MFDFDFAFRFVALRTNGIFGNPINIGIKSTNRTSMIQKTVQKIISFRLTSQPQAGAKPLLEGVGSIRQVFRDLSVEEKLFLR